MSTTLRTILTALPALCVLGCVTNSTMSSPAARSYAKFDHMPPPMIEKFDAALTAMSENEGSEHIGAADLFWPDRAIVTVAFNGGSDELYELIELTAKEWTRDAAFFDFDFHTSDGKFRKWSIADATPAADIRISFRAGQEWGGYWSYLGTMSRYFPANEPTMNFEGFVTELIKFHGRYDTPEWRLTYAHSTILHEFGHALGLAHEHFHPQCQSDMKFEADDGYAPTFDHYKTYAPDKKGRSPGVNLYFAGPPNNWDPKTIAFNLDSQTFFERSEALLASVTGRDEEFSTLATRSVDQASVMLYGLPGFLLKGGVNSPCNYVAQTGEPAGLDYATALSDRDRKFFGLVYE